MIQEDEKYKTLRDSLRALPRVKAKKDFEARLMQRIREAETPVVNVTQKIKTERETKSWFANLFRPAFMPALGLTAVLLITIVVYFAFFSKMNNGVTQNTQQFVTSTNQGDLIIYVKKDPDNYSENYPKEYSAVNPDENSTSERDAAPTETQSDYFAKPDPSRTVMPDLKPDRVSEEQKIEMQKSSDLSKDKGVDTRGERKSDDVIMKKESKGMLKTETQNSPYNIRDEKKNEVLDEENQVNQQEKSVT